MLLHVLMVVGLTIMAAGNQITTPGSDSTLIPGAKGAPIAEQAITNIKTSCVFDDDKLFMRRLAFVESFDGVEPDANRTGYHGGIWQVDEAMFDKLKESQSHRVLSKYTDQFKKAFGKDWETTTWEDCRKPLFSALAARLYIQLAIDPIGKSFPRDIPAQGSFWNTYYHGGEADIFIKAAEKLNKGCKQLSGVDLVFILDSSGSVGSTDFDKMKDFVIDVVGSFNVSANETQVGVVTYSSSVYNNFYLNTYETKSQVLNAVNNIRYQGGSTNSHLALDSLYQTMFTADKGARDMTAGIPRVGIFLTDGYSNSQSETIASAREVHDADITMFSIGVGSNVGKTELEAIASAPECLYLFMLDGFKEVESLKYAIEEGTCEAPIIVSPGKNGTKVKGNVPSKGDQNCKVKVSTGGATIQINAKSGSVKFFVSTNTYPSEAYYDAMIFAVPGKPGVMFLQKPATADEEGIVYCNIKGDEKEDSTVDVGILPGDKDHCRNVDCKNGGTCVDDLQNSYTCSCAPGFEGTHCETDIVECLPSTCKFGTCEDRGNGYVCVCEPDYTGVNCDEVALFDCKQRNPCNAASRDANKYFFAHDDPSRFVQCAENGECHANSCPLGLTWEHAVLACTR